MPKPITISTADRNAMVVFISGATQKAPVYKQVKSMFHGAQIIFLKHGETVTALTDDQLGEYGLRRLTKEEFIARNEPNELTVPAEAAAS